MSSEMRIDYDRKFHFKQVSKYVYNKYYPESLNFKFCDFKVSIKEEKQMKYIGPRFNLFC